jgi:hypothetical protein
LFGILRPCRHRLNSDLRSEWMAHLCGLCLALRDEQGHVARLATNRDTLVISALVAAQSVPGTGRRHAGPCLLRGLREADVAAGPGPRLAACVSLLLVAASLRDHTADGDGLLRHRVPAAVAARLAEGWTEAARRTGAQLGFDASPLLSVVERQREVEAAARRGTDLRVVTEPVETAVAAAFAHTAVLTGCPDNAAPLAAAGRAFGRVAHLVDAVEDLEADRVTGAWNPLLATETGLKEARLVVDGAVSELRSALVRTDLAQGRLVHLLLAHETAHAVSRAFQSAVQTPPQQAPSEFPSLPPPPEPPAPAHPTPARRPAGPEGGSGGWCFDWSCCDRCEDCSCCCDTCECCDCCAGCAQCCDCDLPGCSASPISR